MSSYRLLPSSSLDGALVAGVMNLHHLLASFQLLVGGRLGAPAAGGTILIVL
jgi:hypothetical protein